LYITGNVNGKSINFLLDSGSTATLISKETFDKLNIKFLPEKNMQVQGVNGSNIKVYGKSNFNITLGQVKIEIQLYYVTLLLKVSLDKILF
jgi:predicted aspartyl protease